MLMQDAGEDDSKLDWVVDLSVDLTEYMLVDFALLGGIDRLLIHIESGFCSTRKSDA